MENFPTPNHLQIPNLSFRMQRFVEFAFISHFCGRCTTSHTLKKMTGETRLFGEQFIYVIFEISSARESVTEQPVFSIPTLQGGIGWEIPP